MAEDKPFPGMNPPTEFVTAKFYVTSDIRGGITGESRRQVFRRFGEHNRRKHENLLRSLDRLIHQCNPLQAFAHFAFFDQLILRGQEDKRYKPIEQHSLEFFQAYFLSCSTSELQVRDTDPWVFARLNCVLRALAQSFSMLGIDRDVPEKDRSAQLIAQTIRLHTLAVRNAGFADQVMAQLRGIFSKIDADYSRKTGIRLTALVTMWENLMKRLNQRVNAYIDELHAALSSSDPEKRIREYCKWQKYAPDVDRQMIEFWRKSGADPDTASVVCINDSNRFLMRFYVLELSDFVAAFPDKIEEDALLPFLRRWSYSPEDLVGQKRENLFLDNPVWERPIIQIGEKRFYWPILEIFHSFGLDMLESLVSEDSELRDKYFNKARSKLFAGARCRANEECFPDGQRFLRLTLAQRHHRQERRK